MSTVVIIESPKKRKTLEKILGPDYSVVASMGHIRDLPTDELGVDLVTFRPDYVTAGDRAAASISQLQHAVRNADRVLLATDPDREGEAIAWHVATVLRLKDPGRITFNAIEAGPVRAAVAAPRQIDHARVQAQEARRVLDRLVGYLASPALSNKLAEPLSVGRVQTPALRLVVERDRAIAAHVATPYHSVTLTFDGGWTAQWDAELPEGEHATDAALANAVAKVQRVTVVRCDDATQTIRPPAPFTTLTLQRAAHVTLKLPPKRCMAVAQSLYEAGFISYMRTDSANLADEAFARLRQFGAAQGLEIVPERRAFREKASAQQGHECIRPTDWSLDVAGDDADEQALYRLIRERAITSQCTDGRDAVRSIELRALDGNHLFRGTGRTILDAGWRSRPGAAIDDEDEDENAPNPIPKILPKSTLTVVKGQTRKHTTRPPKRYTLSSLLVALEDRGIGRPSTYATIIDTLFKRAYVIEEKRCLVATPKGTTLIDAVVGRFQFAELDYTAELEDRLDAIAEEQMTYRDVLDDAYTRLRSEIDGLGGPAHACPTCGAALRKHDYHGHRFWGCSAHPHCSFTAEDADGAPAPVIPCPQCNAPLRRRVKSAKKDPKGKGYDFWSCSAYPACSTTFKTAASGLPDLPNVNDQSHP